MRDKAAVTKAPAITADQETPDEWASLYVLRIYSIICGSKRVVRGMGFIKKGTAIFALSFRHGKIYQPMCS
jgi:hypothetical protein